MCLTSEVRSFGGDARHPQRVVRLQLGGGSGPPSTGCLPRYDPQTQVVVRR